MEFGKIVSLTQQPDAWVIFEVATFGTLSKIYKNLNHQIPEKAKIANEFGINLHNELSSWLEAISYLRNKYKDVPFIGIEPAIKPASLQSVTKKIGVLATRSTLASDLFAKTSEHLKQEEQVEIIEQVGEGLVDLIEAGRIESPEMTQLLRHHLLPMVTLGIDYLVLGCTHYPYLLPQIQKIIPPHIKVIDSGYAVARQTKNILLQHYLLNENTSITPQHLWIANGNIEVLKQFVPKKKGLENLQIAKF